MERYRLTRGTLIGTVWHDRGSVVGAEGRHAEHLVKSGAALPLTAPVEQAAAPAQSQASRATAPRQR